MSTWWRRNRWGLVLLPVALVLALVGSSSRLDDYWWSRGLHSAVRTDGSGVAHVSTQYDDGTLRYPIAADVSLTSLTRVTSVDDGNGTATPVILPERGALWKVTMHWSADPNTVLVGCQLGLQGSDGRFWEKRYPALVDAGTTTLPLSPCTPGDTPGPQPKLDLSGIAPPKAGEERPGAYDVSVYVVTAADATPSEVRIWWYPPTYAALPVSR